MTELTSLSVTECITQLNGVLESQVMSIEGEVQGYRLSQGKWGFFCLKDQQSIIECFVMGFRVRVPLEDGMTVRVLATPGIYAKSGRFRLTVERIEVVGEGALARQFELLKKKLEAEGLFSPARKRVLPSFPQNIGLIASFESAAYSDFIKVLQGRFSDLTIHAAHAVVQGESAASSVIGALQAMATIEPPLDAVVITRGGGSLEDLRAFNDEALAREIFRCPVPVITAIGHERDVTIVDYVADVRASTPSNAAELLVPSRQDVLRHCDGIARRMESGVRRHLLLAVHDLDRVTHQVAALVERSSRAIVGQMHRVVSLLRVLENRQLSLTERLNVVPSRLVRSLDRRLATQQSWLKDRQSRLASVDPKRLLKKGYSIVRREGRVVKSANQLQPGDRLDVSFGDGEVTTKVI